MRLSVQVALLATVYAAGCASRAQEAPAPEPSTKSGRVALAPDLRRRVAALAAEVAREPSSTANASARADLVWEWANSLARAGIVLPPDLPPTIAFLRWAEADGWRMVLPPGMSQPLELQLSRLDGYIEELESLQSGRRPGTLDLITPGPVEALAMVTLEQVYTVGDTPIAPGGTFLLGGTSGSAGEGRVQHASPSAPNYVTARCSRPGVTLEPAMVPWNGVHSSIMATVPTPAYRVAGGALERGDTVTFTIGDRSQGSPGFSVPTFASDRFLFPVYVDPDGSGNFFTLDWPSLVIAGGAVVKRMRALAPSVVAMGEPFSITVRSEDDAMNRASGPIGSYEVLLGDDVVARVAAGGPPVATVDGLRIAEPGAHRLVVRSADGALTATSNPVWVREAPAHRIFWGETHGHTGFAEGQGSPRAFFTYAVEDARLDFATLTEHDLWMDDGEWLALQSLTREFNAKGRFAGILGYEWTAWNDRGGHHNVFFRDPSSARVGVHDAGRLPDLYRLLHERYAPEEVLVIPHAHVAGDWRQSDPDFERLVELYSTHGTFESFANAYLRNGFELGFVGASDTHNAKPGLTPPHLAIFMQPGGLAAVLAPAATTEAIFGALRDLRTYATSGQRIVLDATLNGKPMGTRQPPTERREIRCQVFGTSPIDRIDLVRNGEVVLSRSYLTAALAERSFVQITFDSSTEVQVGRRDDPRGSRPWRGTLDVGGARLMGVTATGIDNPLRERVAIDPETPGRVRFAIVTRGRADSFLLELEGASADTTLRIDVEPGKEAGAPFTVRPAADLPATAVVLRLDQLEKGRLEHELRVDEHVDSIALQVLDPAGALDRELAYTDLDGGRPGDYYYLRVTQLDGGQAWSSPWWVGERGAGD